jgi:hypothetical protein
MQGKASNTIEYKRRKSEQSTRSKDDEWRGWEKGKINIFVEHGTDNFNTILIIDEDK